MSHYLKNWKPYQEFLEQQEREKREKEEVRKKEDRERQKRIEEALELLSEEKRVEINETVIEPLNKRLRETNKKIKELREGMSEAITYSYENFKESLRQVVQEQAEKVFERQFEGFVKTLNEISDIQNETLKVFETVVVEFAKKIKKEG